MSTNALLVVRLLDAVKRRSSDVAKKRKQQSHSLDEWKHDHVVLQGARGALTHDAA